MRTPPCDIHHRHLPTHLDHSVYLLQNYPCTSLITMSDIATLSATVPSSSTQITPFGAHLLSWRPNG